MILHCVRKLLTEIIQSDAAFEVVGTAPNPIVARQLIKDLSPDVLTLDVEMPQMDGIDFLERLMRLRPMPVVMISSLTERGNEVTLRALELGAVDFITKPKVGIRRRPARLYGRHPQQTEGGGVRTYRPPECE